MARACRVNSPKPGIRARLSCAIAPILPRWLRLRARYLVGRKSADNGHFLVGSEFVAKKGEEMRDWPEELILAELAALSRAENAALTTGSMSRLRNIFGYRFPRVARRPVAQDAAMAVALVHPPPRALVRE